MMSNLNSCASFDIPFVMLIMHVLCVFNKFLVINMIVYLDTDIEKYLLISRMKILLKVSTVNFVIQYYFS